MIEMTHQEFVNKLKSGEYKVQLSKFYPEHDEAGLIELIAEKAEIYSDFFKENPNDDVLRIGKTGEVWSFPFSEFHNWQHPRKTVLVLKENTVTFYIKSYVDRDSGFKLESDSIMDDLIDQPFKYQIDVPTKSLTFANWFKNSPDNAKGYSEYKHDTDLSSSWGRRNLTWFMADSGVGYGQMGNMSLGVWANDYEIILTTQYIMERGYTDDDERDVLEAYLKQHNFKEKGYLSLSVWRYEVTDSEKAKELEVGGEDSVIVPIEGTRIEGTQYYGSNAHGKSPISSLVYAHLKVS